MFLLFVFPFARKKKKKKKAVELKRNKVLEDDKPYLLRILAVSIATSCFLLPPPMETDVDDIITRLFMMSLPGDRTLLRVLFFSSETLYINIYIHGRWCGFARSGWLCACCCNDEDWIVFVCFFVVFFDLGFRLVLVECSELFFSTFFLMTENELMQIAPFGAAVFGVCSPLWATNLLEMLNFDLFAAAAAETLLPARADVRFTSHFTENNKRLRNKKTWGWRGALGDVLFHTCWGLYETNHYNDLKKYI